ncbi:MAG: alpha/beta hydrolase [Myxococcales bacterium FL481]|nr:MAG: alpha/beta hydrolase [Myxococcales bacterium FL481]
MLRRILSRTELAGKAVKDTYAYARQLVRGNAVVGEPAELATELPPVVLVHGFLGTRGTMQPLTERFRADGRAVFSYAYGRGQTSCLRRSAEGLVQQIASLRERLDVERVDLVGFSMGGLVSLHALNFLDGARHARSLTLLGTPVSGTWMGLAGVATMGAISSSVWQVVPHSRFLDDLVRVGAPSGVRVRQIFARHDAFCPLGPRLQGVAENDYLVLAGGHASLLINPQVYDAVRSGHEGLGETSRPTLDARHQPALGAYVRP